jgi:hypothetical protein
MSSGLNRVMLLGDVEAEPELYVTRAGQTVLHLRLGTRESYLDKDRVRRELVSYHQVVVVGKRADALAKTLRRRRAPRRRRRAAPPPCLERFSTAHGAQRSHQRALRGVSGPRADSTRPAHVASRAEARLATCAVL